MSAHRCKANFPAALAWIDLCSRRLVISQVRTHRRRMTRSPLSQMGDKRGDRYAFKVGVIGLGISTSVLAIIAIFSF
jgi:hypothetical protein